MFKKRYADVFAGDRAWKRVKTAIGLTYQWDGGSTYVQNPPYFARMAAEAGKFGDIKGARLLALVGRQHHHRPHLARRFDQEGQPRRQISGRACASPSPISIPMARGAAITR